MFLFGGGTDLSFFDLSFYPRFCSSFDLYPRISVLSAAIDGKRSDLRNFNWIGFLRFLIRFQILPDFIRSPSEFFWFLLRNRERNIFLIFLNLVYQILDVSLLYLFFFLFCENVTVFFELNQRIICSIRFYIFEFIRGYVDFLATSTNDWQISINWILNVIPRRYKM